MLDLLVIFPSNCAVLRVFNFNFPSFVHEGLLHRRSHLILQINEPHGVLGFVFPGPLLLKEFLIFTQFEFFDSPAELVQTNPQCNKHVVGHLLDVERLLLSHNLIWCDELLVL